MGIGYLRQNGGWGGYGNIRMSCKYQILWDKEKVPVFRQLTFLNIIREVRRLNIVFLSYTGRRSDFDIACPKMAVQTLKHRISSVKGGK